MWPCHLEQNNVHSEKLYNDPSSFGERRSLTLLFLLNRRDENLYRFETTMYICVVFCHLFKYTGEKYSKNKRSNENDIYAI